MKHSFAIAMRAVVALGRADGVDRRRIDAPRVASGTTFRTIVASAPLALAGTTVPVGFDQKPVHRPCSVWGGEVIPLSIRDTGKNKAKFAQLNEDQGKVVA
jgi:hypothetical protein